MLVADSQQLFAEALSRALSRRPDLDALGGAPPTADAVVEAAKRLRPDVAVIDALLCDGIGAAGITRQIRAEVIGCAVLVVSGVPGLDQIEAARSAGAAGFLPKTVGVELIADAVRRAHAGESPVYTEELERFVKAIHYHVLLRVRDHRRYRRLSLREVEVLRLLTSGYRLQSLPLELGVTLGTARNHVHNLLTKLGVGSELAAVRMARRWGWFAGGAEERPLPPTRTNGHG